MLDRPFRAIFPSWNEAGSGRSTVGALLDCILAAEELTYEELYREKDGNGLQGGLQAALLCVSVSARKTANHDSLNVTKSPLPSSSPALAPGTPSPVWRCASCDMVS